MNRGRAMNENDLIEILLDHLCNGELRDALLDEAQADKDAPRGDLTARTFAEAGLLTHNDGVVIRVGDVEFQLTIVRSK